MSLPGLSCSISEAPTGTIYDIFCKSVYLEYDCTHIIEPTQSLTVCKCKITTLHFCTRVLWDILNHTDSSPLLQGILDVITHMRVFMCICMMGLLSQRKTETGCAHLQCAFAPLSCVLRGSHNLERAISGVKTY